MERLLERVTLTRIFGLATVLGFFSALQAYNYVSMFSEKAQPFGVLLALNVTYWYAWALLVPGILWMARTYRFGRQTWKRAVPMHIVGVLIATFLHAMLSVTARVAIMAWMAERNLDWWLIVRERFFLYFDWEMMTYWAVVGFSHAVDFYRESQERELAGAQLQARLAEAQLQALQRQLHPHFLFNTLHTISALMHRDVDAADEMLARLSDLLRLTLDGGNMQIVPLKDELDFVRKYLDIERTRYGDRLQVLIEAEPDTLDAAVPNFVLQPLVENALRHGIAPKVGGGRVEIDVRRDGDRLLLVVRDDGAGVKPERLQAAREGVGLANTRSRLSHLYGDQHAFDFQATNGQGVVVTIAIPFVLDGGPEMTIRSVA
jgi:signal transduction histidine kinase